MPTLSKLASNPPLYKVSLTPRDLYMSIELAHKLPGQPLHTHLIAYMLWEIWNAKLRPADACPIDHEAHHTMDSKHSFPSTY